jgi:hypothetical protein
MGEWTFATRTPLRPSLSGSFLSGPFLRRSSERYRASMAGSNGNCPEGLSSRLLHFKWVLSHLRTPILSWGA